MNKITWLAVADARGHLVRAHIMRNQLAERDVDVQILTTSERGVEFLEEFGTPAECIGTAFRVEFDSRQNVEMLQTARRAVRYLTDPGQFLADLDRLRAASRDSAFLVNDFHPALLVGSSLQPADLPVVHLYGSNLWRAMTKPVRQPAGRWVNPLYERLLTRLRGAGRARVVHRPMAPMETRWTAPDRVELPPLVPPASADDGWEPSAERPRVAVYLNPHFRDPEVATAVESAVDAVDGTLYAIGEGFADRDRWRGCDPNFASRVADADLLVSAPGMGAVGMSRTYRTPFLMVRTDQPEQKRNAQRLLSGDGTPLCDVVDLEASELAPLLESRVRKLVDSPGTDSPSRLDDVHGAWRRAFLELLERVAPESRPEAAA